MISIKFTDTLFGGFYAIAFENFTFHFLKSDIEDQYKKGTTIKMLMTWEMERFIKELKNAHKKSG